MISSAIRIQLDIQETLRNWIGKYEIQTDKLGAVIHHRSSVESTNVNDYYEKNFQIGLLR